ncbi:hypothetical protein Belba_3541 [Belliella baltica DSM 15883]|uniref:DUF5723 domain-containing protein n=1 Tax=Belliella baltica (strain DSM 15883 / CIP 108006 / LMG 21964 / BA134) TaxID=866536 RepID=I3Z9X1_BELBD|nr:hypothetical protein [Belliella baltica]AFL86039.1 hypothetical protein Belba_3541 [Belliella baltica DSM 15883]
MRISILLFLVFFCTLSFAQSNKGNRSTIYATYGRTGANMRLFNEMLANKGLTPMRNGYSNLGLGYQTRYNDFILGFELYQNAGMKSTFNGYDLDYRTTRALLNVGYSLTEEGSFQFIHYMSVGSGFLNFQMLKENPAETVNQFLQNPAHGFVLRDGNIHKGSRYFTGLLTEIGFQASLDVEIPGREEVLEIMTKFGYAFSPFENSWELNGIQFDNAQSGAFIRAGVGISLPDHNFFYKDASLGIHLISGLHFTSPDQFNTILEQNGLEPFEEKPNNWGVKILGESKGILYGADIYNVSLQGGANGFSSQTLNSVRLYGNFGRKFFERKNLELGGVAGIGYANLRYSLINNSKPDFPLLFEEPDFDGYLRKSGMMAKPEIYIMYAVPFSSERGINLVFGIQGGYEAPLSRFRLLDTPMYKYMANPYLHFSVGIRP